MRDGFSLVEVLVALAITAIVSVTLVGSVSGMTAHIASWRGETQLTLLAKAIAHDIALRGIPQNETGSFDTHPDYEWRVSIVDAEKPVKEILLTVTAPTGRSFSTRILH